jgi:hypothetical protein
VQLNPSILDPLIPIIVSVLKQSGFDRRWNAWIAIAVYVVWTGASLMLGLRATDGPVTPESFISAFVAAATTGFVSYQLIWRNLGEQTLENATSVVKGPETDEVLDDPNTPGDPGANG